MNQRKMALKKNLLASIIFTGIICGNGTNVFANEIQDEDFSLDPIIITAQRHKSDDLDTPSAVSVYSQAQLKETGATNVQDALKYGMGLLYQAQGPRGTSQGTMTSKIVIRGVEKGTLVLIDGVPLNQSGRYNLDDLTLETVDRIEVVRGGGAVLYGSEATGGVINIITKGKQSNSVRTAFGNYGMQSHAANTQMGKLGISYSYDKTGVVDNISDPAGGKPVAGLYYNTIRVEHNTFNWRYDFDEHIYLSHTYGENNAHYVYRYDGRGNAAAASMDYKNATNTTRNNMTRLHYDKGDLTANFFFNSREQKTVNRTAVDSPIKPTFDPAKTTLDDKTNHDKTIGFNVQKQWIIQALS